MLATLVAVLRLLVLRCVSCVCRRGTGSLCERRTNLLASRFPSFQRWRSKRAGPEAGNLGSFRSGGTATPFSRSVEFSRPGAPLTDAAGGVELQLVD